MTPALDLVVKNARVVRPNRNAVDLLDIGVKDGRFARLAPDIRPEDAERTEYLLSGVLSEGSKRGLSYNRMAELLAWNPARRYGILQKGDIAPGYDADLVLVDPHESFVVRAAESESKQGYTPFEGMALTGRVKSTFLRGELIYDRGQCVGPARGRYIRRPTKAVE